jgi:hypothetical protein
MLYIYIYYRDILKFSLNILLKIRIFSWYEKYRISGKLLFLYTTHNVDLLHDSQFLTTDLQKEAN